MPLHTRYVSDASNGLLDVFDTYNEVSCGAPSTPRWCASHIGMPATAAQIERTYDVPMTRPPEDGGGRPSVVDTGSAPPRTRSAASWSSERWSAKATVDVIVADCAVIEQAKGMLIAV